MRTTVKGAMLCLFLVTLGVGIYSLMSWERSEDPRQGQKDKRPATSVLEAKSIEHASHAGERLLSNHTDREEYAPAVNDEAAPVSVRGDIPGVPISSLHQETIRNDLWRRVYGGHWVYMLRNGLPEEIRAWLQSLDSDSIVEALEDWQGQSDMKRIALGLALYKNPSIADRYRDDLSRWAANSESTSVFNAILLALSKTSTEKLPYDLLAGASRAFGYDAEGISWEILTSLLPDRSVLAPELTSLAYGLGDENRSNEVYAAWAISMRELGPDSAQQVAAWLGSRYYVGSARERNGIIQALGRLDTPEAYQQAMQVYYVEEDSQVRMQLVRLVRAASGTPSIQRSNFLKDCMLFLDHVQLTDLEVVAGIKASHIILGSNDSK